MVGGIAGLFIAVWFYRTAKALEDKKPWTWVFIGLICFFGFVAIWRMMVVRPMLLLLGQHHNDITTFLIGSSALLFAALFAAHIRRRYLIKGQRE